MLMSRLTGNSTPQTMMSSVIVVASPSLPGIPRWTRSLSGLNTTASTIAHRIAPEKAQSDQIIAAVTKMRSSVKPAVSRAVAGVGPFSMSATLARFPRPHQCAPSLAHWTWAVRALRNQSLFDLSGKNRNVRVRRWFSALGLKYRDMNGRS